MRNVLVPVPAPVMHLSPLSSGSCSCDLLRCMIVFELDDLRRRSSRCPFRLLWRAVRNLGLAWRRLPLTVNPPLYWEAGFGVVISCCAGVGRVGGVRGR